MSLTMLLLVRVNVSKRHVSKGGISVREGVKNVGECFGNNVGRF